MNDEEVERLLAGLKLKKPKGRDAEKVAGYADLLGRIFDNYKTLKLTGADFAIPRNSPAFFGKR